MKDARSLESLHMATRRTWRGIALACEPMVKTRAEEAIRAVYSIATGRPPDSILFFDSPLQAKIAGTLLAGDYRKPRLGSVYGRLGVNLLVSGRLRMDEGSLPPRIAEYGLEQLERPIHSALDVADRSALDPAAVKRAFDALCNQLPPEERRSLVVPWRCPKGVLRRARREAEQALEQRRWMSFAAHYSFSRMATPGQSAGAGERLKSAVIDVCETCGWCWLYPDVAIISDRPTLVRLDALGRLHAEDGPAVGYRDGFSIHALHGVRVSRRVIERPSEITVADADNEPNLEVRRALIERMGRRRYLSLSGAVVVARDETGLLWRRRLPSRRDEPQRALCFVEVINGTCEPDGTRRHYFLRVPPTSRTAREAVAWTYGLAAGAYRPHIRT
jgi:hypothetical protein